LKSDKGAGGKAKVASVLSSLRYLLADVIGDDDASPPFLPDSLPAEAAPIVSDGIRLLTEYQGPTYAQLYVDRLRRFIGLRDVDAGMLCEIARLMAMRMAYEDPIRIAQLKLFQLENGEVPHVDVKKFRLDELIGALPGPAADPLLFVLGTIGWLHKRVSIPFSTASRWGIRRLKIEAALRRWRLFSGRYEEERVWVERWLHMISRCLVKQPQSAAAVVDTASMITGYGDVYRRGLADWHAIIDGLAKPTFDGVLALDDLAGAIAEARAAVMLDPRRGALKRTIAHIRARALGAGADVAAA
jgi:uncharacterized protein DUF6537